MKLGGIFPEGQHIEELSMFDDFRVGDYFIITTEPSSWNSLANENCPPQINKWKKVKKSSYPYKGRIKKILRKIENYGDGHTFVSVGMTEGKYGWSLESLISEGQIIHDKQKIRKKKLQRLKKI